jgi:hypothetical protein
MTLHELRHAVDVVRDAIDRKDARIAALERAIRDLELARLRQAEGGDPAVVRKVEDRLFELMRTPV